jgi:hypothetical protein
MQASRLSFFGVLVVLALFSFGCKSDPKVEKTATPPTVSAPVASNPTSTDTTAAAPKETPTTTTTPTPATTTTPTTTPVTPTEDHDIPDRVLSENRIGTQLIYITESITAEKLPYIVGGPQLQDCSGIFLRIIDSLRAHIPVLANKSKYIFPNAKEHRSSRGIARWYFEHHNLHIVEDGKADANRIRPGSVMFFANTDKQYSNMTIDLLAGPPSGVPKGVIMHIATVVSVVKDDAGNVIKYTMMHGRNSKYPASPTGGNCDCGGTTAKQHAIFPFGNYNQQWVAIANIETPVQ